MRPLLSIALCLPMLAALSAGAAQARTEALLIGVSDYAELDADLRGPANDLPLLAAALTRRGLPASDIIVLGGSEATHDAINAALAQAAGRLGAGDSFIFYFAGHGTQVPDQDGDENGGPDEMLLPADVQPWSKQDADIPNGLRDDALRATLGAMIDHGVEVVAILDACHSATGFRALGGVGVERSLDPAALGVPDLSDAPARGNGARFNGDFAFLYSSQSDERSFEHPVGAPDDPANWHGDFTLGLVQALDSGAPTWRAALDMATDRMVVAGIEQTPDGEGPLLDAVILGQASAGAHRLRLDNWVIDAGLLAGLNPGASVAVYDAAVGGAELARVQVTDVTALATTLPKDAPQSGYVEVLDSGAPAPLRLSVPQVLDGADYGPLRAELAELATTETAALSFDQAAFDIGLVLTDGTLALTGSDGVLDPDGPGSSPRLAKGGALADFLDRAIRARQMLKAVTRVGGKSGFKLKGAELKVTTLQAQGTPSAGECASPGPQEPLGDRVGDCDQIWLSIENPSRSAQDVTVLYIDADLNIELVWPLDDTSNRLLGGESTEIGLEIRNPAGRSATEDILVLSVPAEPGAPRRVLDALADRDAASRDMADDALLAGLMAAVDPEVSRAFGTRPASISLNTTRIRLKLAASSGLH